MAERDAALKPSAARSDGIDGNALMAHDTRPVSAFLQFQDTLAGYVGGNGGDSRGKAS